MRAKSNPFFRNAITAIKRLFRILTGNRPRFWARARWIYWFSLEMSVPKYFSDSSVSLPDASSSESASLTALSSDAVSSPYRPRIATRSTSSDIVAILMFASGCTFR